jgi:hypothetical protein
MERAPTHKNVRNSSCFERADIRSSDVHAKIAESAEQNRNLTWSDGDRMVLLFDRPTALID